MTYRDDKGDLNSQSGNYQKERQEAQEREGDRLINENPVSQKEKQERLMIEGGGEGAGRERDCD